MFYKDNGKLYRKRQLQGGNYDRKACSFSK